MKECIVWEVIFVYFMCCYMYMIFEKIFLFYILLIGVVYKFIYIYKYLYVYIYDIMNLYYNVLFIYIIKYIFLKYCEMFKLNIILFL